MDCDTIAIDRDTVAIDGDTGRKDLVTIVPPKGRVRYYRQILGRGFGKKAPALAAIELREASRLTAIAEIARDMFEAGDSRISANDLVRLQGAAKSARLRVEAMRPKPKPAATLSDHYNEDTAHA